MPQPVGESSTAYPVTFRLVITKPDGAKVDLYPIKSDGPGTFWLTYTVDQIGSWTFQLTAEQDPWFQSSSVTKTLVVQKDPIPAWPAKPLPTDAWTYPISPENREWGSTSGGWYQPKYDESASNYNPYSQGPNSPHILWKVQPASGMAGLIGGEFRVDQRYSATSHSIDAVMGGRGYSRAGGNITCFDIRNGEELWTTNGTFTVASIRSGVPSLYELGRTRFRVYNGLTGALTLDVPGMVPLGGSQGLGTGFQDPYVYSAQSTSVAGIEFIIKWTTEGTASNFTSRIIWNITSPFKPEAPHNQSTQTFGMTFYKDILFQLGWPYYAESGAINTTNGKTLWHYTLTPDKAWLQSRGALGATNGLAVCPVNLPASCEMAAWNMTTGNIEWFSQKTADPWGAFWSYQYATAYNLIYKCTYAGLYAFDAANGKIVWYYSAGNAGMETPYAIQAPGESGLEKAETTWPFGSTECVVADGKVYAPSTEHSPTLYYRGTKLHCVDAYTGKFIWSILGYYTVSAVAEGAVFATSAYDGCAYAFSKGKTETTVSASAKIVPKGSALLIEGTVTDQSPAQKGTPAVSEASMTAWMEYLHVQQAKPTNATGVSVRLTAVDANGAAQNIGTVTTDINGNFICMWTPQAEGAYRIYADFDGSNSYYASSAETAVGVTSAPSASAAPTATATPAATEVPTASPSTAPTPPGIVAGTDMYLITAAVIVVIVVIAAIAIFFRRRR